MVEMTIASSWFDLAFLKIIHKNGYFPQGEGGREEGSPLSVLVRRWGDFFYPVHNHLPCALASTAAIIQPEKSRYISNQPESSASFAYSSVDKNMVLMMMHK